MTADREAVESHGDPLPESVPVEFPCKGPACDDEVHTYLTAADIEAHETVRVLRYTPETDDERLVRYWFCSPECRAGFVAAVEGGDREETLYDEADGEAPRGEA